PMSLAVPGGQSGYGRGPSSFTERMYVMSVELNAYLFFPGNAGQAIAFYQQVFVGEVTISRVGDVDPTAAPEQKNLVISAQLTGVRASGRSAAVPGLRLHGANHRHSPPRPWSGQPGCSSTRNRRLPSRPWTQMQRPRLPPRCAERTAAHDGARRPGTAARPLR